jgi:hypothetical protein
VATKTQVPETLSTFHGLRAAVRLAELRIQQSGTSPARAAELRGVVDRLLDEILRKARDEAAA